MFLGIIVQVLWCLYVFTVTYLLLLFFLIYLFVTAKAALWKKSLVHAARQIANNLSQIAKKFELYFLTFA